MMKPLISGLGILILILSLATCSAGGATNATPLTSTTATAAVTATVTASTPAAPAPSASILAALQTPAAEDASAWQGEDAVPIALAGATITADGAGVTVDGNTATITAAGSYRLSGTLDDGQIVVDSADAEPVRLILDGATLRNRTGAPILVRKAAAVV
ncbi:MAG: carbohydrate-binding domain-containing protein, partial [Caldilineaceae bacterium]|nr:carbohydrate-binding domain-containing protein [Caldilineaceae bacterium]